MSKEPEKPITAVGFSDVDQAADPQNLVKYLDAATALVVIQEYKRRSYAYLKLKESDHVLDVGCGTGDDAPEIAQLVGNSGLVVGIDSSDAMITDARKRVEGLELPVEFTVGDAHWLEFEDNTFDACRSDRVFQHIDDPRKALVEIVRVSRHGGRIAITDPDWGTLVIDSSDRALTTRILNHYCDRGRRNPWMGRSIVRIAQRSWTDRCRRRSRKCDCY